MFIFTQTWSRSCTPIVTRRDWDKGKQITTFSSSQTTRRLQHSSDRIIFLYKARSTRRPLLRVTRGGGDGVFRYRSSGTITAVLEIESRIFEIPRTEYDDIDRFPFSSIVLKTNVMYNNNNDEKH